MFDRFIRMAKARHALRAGRLEEALRLAQDPLVSSDRRAEAIREAAAAKLLARARLAAERGDHAAALQDLEPLLRGIGGAEVTALAGQWQAARAQQQQERLAAQQALQAAQKLAAQGQLRAAESAVARAPAATALAAERRAAHEFVADRRRRAELHHAAVAQALSAGEVERAIAEFASARAIDADQSLAVELLRALQEAAGRHAADVVLTALSTGGLSRALAACREHAALVPGCPSTPGFAVARGKLADAALACLRAAAAALTVEPVVRELQAADPRWFDGKVDVVAVAGQVLQVEALRRRGQPTALGEALSALGAQIGAKALVREGEHAIEAGAQAAARVAEARERAGRGDLVTARAALIAVLETWPLHEAARAEMDLLDQSGAERERRLATARQAAREGRLREASALAMGIGEAGAAGEEAKLLLKEVRARMEMVARGIDQVRAAMHTQQAATVEGVQHLQRRVEELAKVHADHEDLPRLLEAIGVEADGLLALDRLQAALQDQKLSLAVAGINTVLALRDRLLQPDRLDARLLGQLDGIARRGDAAVLAGRLEEAELCRQALQAAGALSADLPVRAGRIADAVAGGRSRAEALVALAHQALATGDLAEAERQAEAARRLCVDGDALRRFDTELAVVRGQEATLAKVEELTADGNFQGAHAHLAGLPPTPPLLRTRIFDMKQNLARAQGLDGSFLLRVDEGGEYLVLRGETVTIGNVREARSDLPILANIAGSHARIERRMSFHGGMEDSILAEGGEVRVGGSPAANHRLRPGDRVQLGPNLQLHYTLPSTRSLTAALTLLGGFQVAGTDRVLLLKDRGRDGRVLLGAGKDVHVRVPGASGEVEVFAHKTGQIRVRADSGTIDGRPFAGEHPIDAGATVQACGISFVLLPWTRR